MRCMCASSGRLWRLLLKVTPSVLKHARSIAALRTLSASRPSVFGGGECLLHQALLCNFASATTSRCRLRSFVRLCRNQSNSAVSRAIGAARIAATMRIQLQRCGFSIGGASLRTIFSAASTSGEHRLVVTAADVCS